MISYAPFWKTLKEKKVSTYKLINEYDISGGTLDHMKKGKGITTTKIDDFCKILNCKVDDIIEYIDESSV